MEVPEDVGTGAGSSAVGDGNAFGVDVFGAPTNNNNNTNNTGGFGNANGFNMFGGNNTMNKSAANTMLDACAEGRTSDKGSTKCSDCAPGKFKNNVNDKVVCTECPIGFAQDETHQTNCTQCRKGEEATAKGSSFCTSCDLGKFNLISGKDCLNCPIGQFQDDKGKTKCKDCRKDTYGVELEKTNGDIRPALSNADF